jgi:hypothetical protein
MNNTIEVWKVIEDFPEYAVSTLGQVKRIQQSYNKPRGKLLRPALTKDGYLRVSLSKNKKHKSLLVHRLVALAYIPNPDTLPEVNHLNGIKTDNSVENLEWCTHKRNMRHAEDSGMMAHPIGERHKLSKLTEDNIKLIRSMYSTGCYTKMDMGKLFGVTPENIACITKRQTWAHVA